jgi:HEAT repeat protein
MPLIRREAGGAAPTPPAPSGEAARRAAARALAQAGDALGLAHALDSETDASVREALLTGLIDIGDPLPLTRFLRSEDAALRVGAAGALRILAQASLPLLPALLADEDPDVRLLATDIAMGLPGETATALLIPVLRDDADENVCAAAVEALCAAGTAAAVPALLALPGRFAANAYLRFSCEAAAAALCGPAPAPAADTRPA